MKNKLLMQHGLIFGEGNGMNFSTKKIEGLNSKVLYWDGIVNIKGGFVFMSDRPDIITLKKEGIFEDVHLKLNKPGNVAELIKSETKNIIIKLLNDKTTNYIADEISPSLFFNSDLADIGGGALLHLTNTLPLIDDSVEVDDVLEFREKRKDLHRNLINHLNSLELRILNSENPGHELKKAIHEIDVGCSEAISVYKEAKVKFNFSNIKFNFNMKEIIAISSSVYGGASLIMPQTASIISGISAGAISTLRWEDSVKIRSIDKKNPFNYIAEINKSKLIA